MVTTDPGTNPDPRPPANPGGGLARSVLANWAWYAVVVVSGFLVPRLIDEYQGQAVLGVWDFGWSLVVYISFLSFGISSAVNRYVARFRASSDWHGLNQTISSSLVLLCAAGLLGLAAAGGLALAVPWMLSNTAAAHVRAAQWTVLLLASNAAIRLPGGVFNGVITGFERFDLLNAIRIARDCSVLLGIAGVLAAGGGIVAIAWVVFAFQVLGEVAKYFVAHRVCRPLRISPWFCSRAVIRDLLAFGGKTVVQSAARAGIYQGVSLVVAIVSGPAALAVFARQRALVMHLLRFVKQYAQVFVPRSSLLLAKQDYDGLRDMLVQSTRYGLYITLPFIVLFLTMGGPLLNLWMGAEYEAPAVLAILALGHLFAVPQLGVYSILMGLNRHGRAAWFEVAAAAASLAMAALLVGPFQVGLIGAALAVSAPVAISGGLLLPLYACRVLGLDVRTYARGVLPGPCAALLPLAAVLVAARAAWPESQLVALAVGAGVGGLATAILYWRWVLPASFRRRIMNRRSYQHPAAATSTVGSTP